MRLSYVCCILGEMNSILSIKAFKMKALQQGDKKTLTSSIVCTEYTNWLCITLQRQSDKNADFFQTELLQ